MWPTLTSCTVIFLKLNVPGQSLTMTYHMHQKPPMRSKTWKKFSVLYIALISLSGMENKILVKCQWMGRLKERDQALKTGLSLRAQWNQRSGQSWPTDTPHCYVPYTHWHCRPFSLQRWLFPPLLGLNFPDSQKWCRLCWAVCLCSVPHRWNFMCT